MGAAYDGCWLGRTSGNKPWVELFAAGSAPSRSAGATASRTGARRPRVVRRVVWIAVSEVTLHGAQIGTRAGQVSSPICAATCAPSSGISLPIQFALTVHLRAAGAAHPPRRELFTC